VREVTAALLYVTQNGIYNGAAISGLHFTAEKIIKVCQVHVLNWPLKRWKRKALSFTTKPNEVGSHTVGC
jgi:hypothetical protein